MTETQSRNLWFTILWGLWCGFEKLEKLKISVADSANRRQRIELIYLKNILTCVRLSSIFPWRKISILKLDE